MTGGPGNQKQRRRRKGKGGNGNGGGSERKYKGKHFDEGIAAGPNQVTQYANMLSAFISYVSKEPHLAPIAKDLEEMKNPRILRQAMRTRDNFINTVTVPDSSTWQDTIQVVIMDANNQPREDENSDPILETVV